MGLIEYNQAFSMGDLMVGLSMLMMTFVICYIFLRIYKKFCDWYDMSMNRQAKYEILEEDCLDKVGKKRGLDLDKELRKRNMLKTPSRNFKKKIEDQVYEEMFGKGKEEK